MNSLIQLTAPVTMSSQDIADLVNSRHDDVKRSIRRLVDKGVIQLPPTAEVKNHLGQTVEVYRIGKRDSYVIVAQLSPEFTARLVDRWQELEAGALAPRLLTTTETLIQMLQLQAEVERRQSAVEQRVDMIASMTSLTAKPQSTETKSEIKARINKQYGLPAWLVDEVLTSISYRPPVFAMVKNSHENALGSSFAVYQIVDITKLFKRFVSECQQATATTATHPGINGRFKLVTRE